ncbi:MAG TPA: HEAT repeat domain-containing protein, partial [Phototrophicaceae bacterium]|nr:HEAT repeat domain-containing protein [Phototrophicaceae bacterium]
MLDMNLVKQLNDSDAEKRKQAVTALAKTKDRQALNYLAAVYQNDRDPQVRELARKAGLFITKHTGGSGGSAKSKPIISDYDDDQEEDTGDTGRSTYYEENETDPFPVSMSISALDEERAAGLVKQALDIHMRGDNDRALKYLQDALKKNPNLARDSYTIGLAATISGMDGDKAIRMIMSEQQEKEKRKRGGSDGARAAGGEPGLGDAIVDLLIYLLVNGGMMAVFLFALVSFFLPQVIQELTTNPNFTQYQTSGTVDINAIVSALNSISVIFIMIYSLIFALVSTILLLI